MKYMLLIAFTIFVAAAATIPARAQVLDTIVVDIPFEFTVRNTVLPAGEYTVKRLNPINPSVMELLNSDGDAKVLFLVGSADTSTTPTKPELIFDRVGDRYFLSEIFESWDNVGVELQKTRTEHQLEEGAMVQVRQVTIVGQNSPDEKR
jgi:hypothetical protein